MGIDVNNGLLIYERHNKKSMFQGFHFMAGYRDFTDTNKLWKIGILFTRHVNKELFS